MYSWVMLMLLDSLSYIKLWVNTLNVMLVWCDVCDSYWIAVGNMLSELGNGEMGECKDRQRSEILAGKQFALLPGIQTTFAYVIHASIFTSIVCHSMSHRFHYLYFASPFFPCFCYCPFYWRLYATVWYCINIAFMLAKNLERRKKTELMRPVK